jgi:hypothetical protein
LDCEIYENSELNEEALVSIFTAITNFQKSLSHRCHRGYEETIARIIKEQLEFIFFKMLVNQHSTSDEKALKVTAVMLSWGIYGASVEWSRQSQSMDQEEYIKLAIPYIRNGINR